jgi:hypothetical protein
MSHTPRSDTTVQGQIFTLLSKYAVGCYLRHCGFPRRTLLDDSLNKPRFAETTGETTQSSSARFTGTTGEPHVNHVGYAFLRWILSQVLVKEEHLGSRNSR